jgi:hypothetical protein
MATGLERTAVSPHTMQAGQVAPQRPSLAQTAMSPLTRAYQAYQQYVGQPFQQIVRGGARGYFGLPLMEDANALGRSAYGQGVALSNVPSIGAPAGAFKVAAQALSAAPEAAMFIGALAKTWNRGSNAKAVEMEKAGVDPQTIWRETGNWRGPDGQWRQEISDQTAQYVGGQPGAPAGQVLRHPELSAAYPDVMQTPVYERPSTSTSSYGQGRIEIGTADRTSKKSKALHELQHAIQEKEGFARGGSPETARNLGFLKHPAVLVPLTNEYTDLWKSLKGKERPKSPFGLPVRDADIREYYDSVEELKDPELRKKFVEILDRINIERRNVFGPDEGAIAAIRNEEAYRRLAGEAEARVTQFRQDITQPKRREFFPEENYDVPINELVIKRY